MQLFPGEYIHVGGDEATKTNWKTCPDCQRRIKEEGLADKDELTIGPKYHSSNFLATSGKPVPLSDENA